MRLTVNSDSQLSKAIGALEETYKEIKYFTVSINTGKKRTLSQNAISHTWYKQISDELKEYLPIEVKSLCKWHVGLPILRAADSEYNEKCVKFIDTLTYEQQILAMEFWPVTSLMTTKQLSEYLTGVQYNYARRGVVLFYPDEEET